MKLLLQRMDYAIFNLLWVCHIIYNRIISVIKRNDNVKDNDMSTTSGDYENCKKHFIHLYTTLGHKGRPVCYMDVYKISSSTDEEKLRHAAAKGFPNKTYLKYNQNKFLDNNGKSQAWLEFSTLTL